MGPGGDPPGHGHRRPGDVRPGMGRARDIEATLRELTPQVLGALVRRYGISTPARTRCRRRCSRGVAVAERGIPHNPRGWLITVASRRLTDSGAASARRRRETTAAASSPPRIWLPAPTSPRRLPTMTRLTLLFLCCHPALPPASQVALTLRAVGGLTHRADCPRVPRARGDHGAAHQPGQAADHRRRGPFAHARAPSGPAARRRAACAIPGVQRGLRRLLRTGPAAGRAHRRGDPPGPRGAPAAARRRRGRRAARADAAHRCTPAGAYSAGRRLVPLAEQDRSRWDRAADRRGRRADHRTLPTRRVGPYQLQAAIAAVHAEAAERRGHRLAPDPRALRTARRARARIPW